MFQCRHNKILKSDLEKLMAGTWSEISLDGHLCDIFEPSTPSARNQVVIYLHGVHLGRLHDKTVFTDLFERNGLRVICPMTQRSWWTDRSCSEFSEEYTAEQFLLRFVLPEIADRWSAKPPQIALLGTSMGGQGALRFSYKYPDLFPVVSAISPAIDYQLRMHDGDEVLAAMYEDPEAARQDTALLHIHPLNWPRHQFFCCDPTDKTWFASADRLHMKLYSLGVPHSHDLETSAGGHSFDYYASMAPRAISFIADALEQEYVRLPVVDSDS